MKILYIYQFLTTGRTPGSLRTFRLCRHLAEEGHDVLILATNFNRFTGGSEGPKNEVIGTSGNPLRIRRIASVRNYRKNLLYRFANYFAFALGVLWRGMVFKNPDIVITSLPPLFIGPIGWLLSMIKRKPFFLEVQDLWPDALEVKGAVKNRFLLSPLYALAKFVYGKADFLVTVTFGIKQEIVQKGIEANRVAVLPNGMDSVLFNRMLSREAVRKRRGWAEEDFVAVYIGTHTEVTSMHTIVKAAEKLKHISGIRFEIFGSGSTTGRLRTMIKEKGLENCHLNGTVGKKEVPGLLCASDACLMCLFETPLAHIYLQNKFFDYLGSGKPVIAALKGHQRAIIEGVGVGVCVDPEDSEGLSWVVLDLSRNPEKCKEMGDRARQYATRHFSLDRIIKEHANFITALAKGRKPRVSQKAVPPLTLE